jgi:hypothetical protein
LRELVGGPDVEEIVGIALFRNEARSRCIGQGLRPCCDVCVVALGVDLELLSEVRVKRRKPILTATGLACAGKE